MGLGKTLQTIALILHMKQTLQSEDPILVIAPSSLLSNWRNELRKFAPALSVSAYYGNARDDLGGDEDKENGEPPAKKRRKSAVCTACAPVAISVFGLQYKYDSATKILRRGPWPGIPKQVKAQEFDKHDKHMFPAQEKTDVVLTTFGTVRSDAAKLSKAKYAAIVIDEAQVIKNSKSQISQSMRGRDWPERSACCFFCR
jgi:SNF2 family DNA or RNA helicase